jgi:uncharacterized membrane protein YgcG
MWRKPGRIGLLAALLFIIGTILFGAVAPAAAAGTCDEVVVDGAGVLKDQLAQVQSRANAVVNLGADVRVRTVGSIGSAATLDSYERSMEQSCPSWHAADGGRKNNLIVLMVAIQQRTTGLYYGGQWESALGSSWPRIQGDLMNPRFRDGDYAGGVSAGLQEIYRVVDLQLHPQNAPAANPSLQPAASPSVDFSGLGRALTVLLVLALVLGGAYGTFRLGSAIRGARVRKRLAQQEALTSQRAVASRITSYSEEFKDLDLRLELLATQVAASEVQPIRDQRAEAQRLADQATRNFGTVRDSVPDPADDRLATAVYDSAKQSYDQLLATVKEADDVLSAARQQITAVEHCLTTAPQAIDAANAALDPAVVRLQAVAQQGFKITANQGFIEQARRLLVQAAAAMQAKRVTEAQQHADAASKLIEQAVSTAEDYPSQREQLASAADRTTARIASLRQAASDGEALLAEILATYPQSVWASVGDDHGEIADKVRQAGTLVSQASKFASMEQQEWDRAQAMLVQANGDLDGVEERLRAISGLKDALDRAQHDAPEELAAARSAVAQAQQAVQQLPSAARGAYAAELDDLEQRLRAVLHHAATEQPDVLQVVASAREIRSAAGTVAAQARAERQRIDRDEENRRALARSVMTSVLINAALSGTRSGRRGGGPRGGSRGGSSGFGGGSSGWGGSGGGGGSSKW